MLSNWSLLKDIQITLYRDIENLRRKLNIKTQKNKQWNINKINLESTFLKMSQDLKLKKKNNFSVKAIPIDCTVK